MQASIDTWRLGWNFTAGESVGPADVFTRGVTPLVLDGANVQLESRSANNSVRPFQWTSVSILGTKSGAPASPAAPYKARLPWRSPRSPCGGWQGRTRYHSAWSLHQAVLFFPSYGGLLP